MKFNWGDTNTLVLAIITILIHDLSFLLLNLIEHLIYLLPSFMPLLGPGAKSGNKAREMCLLSISPDFNSWRKHHDQKGAQ